MKKNSLASQNGLLTCGDKSRIVGDVVEVQLFGRAGVSQMVEKLICNRRLHRSILSRLTYSLSIRQLFILTVISAYQGGRNE
jgi:hypothetical protein